MSSVSAPPIPVAVFPSITPFSTLPYKTKDKKKNALKTPLTPLQLEGVGLAINAFRKVYGTERCGFFLGDGAGVGKGRQIASVIRHAVSTGASRHLWLSVSRSLIDDARRDLDDVGLMGVKLHSGDTLLSGEKGLGFNADGVLFITYQMLISNKRIDQVVKWLAPNQTTSSFGGCIVFDECHKAKNIGETKTSEYVTKLQDRLPMARVLYCSATGVSDIKHMHYAKRLRLWGLATAYPTFDHFQKMLNDRGIGGLEMLSLEMKLQGMFVSRSLSWDGAEFETCECQLSEDHVEMYNNTCNWWLEVKAAMEGAIAKLDGNVAKNLWTTYWSAVQRFYKEFSVCAKVPFVCDEAKKDIERGNSVVIGLQGTGEQSTRDMMALELDLIKEQRGLTSTKSLRFEDASFGSLVSTIGASAASFLLNHFPVKRKPPTVPDTPRLPECPSHDDIEKFRVIMATRENALRALNAEPDADLVKMRDEFISQIRNLKLPPNPLDDIVDRLGGEYAVAEMTGRAGRILREEKSGSYKYKKRAGSAAASCKGLSSAKSEVEMDQVNIQERKNFMNGEKLAAVISDAASTGISLHASKLVESRYRRRVHYTIELAWSADKAVQQLGRTHRAGQQTAPQYRNVITNLGGERRFAAAGETRKKLGLFFDV